MKLLVTLLFPFLAAAQLQLNVAPVGGTEQAMPGVYDMGSVNVAESSSVRFRLKNTGTSSVTLSYLYIAGSGFSMTGAPSLPNVVAPGVNVDFTVQFSPPNFGSYSANLQVNSTGYIFRGTGLSGAAVRVDGNDVAAGGAIDFGAVERGNASGKTVQLVNISTEPVTISSVSVTGSAFSASTGKLFPLTIPPGAGAVFPIQFAPTASGIATGTLTIDKRKFGLTGSAYEPTMPRPSVVIETPSIRSGEQGRVSVRLAAVSKANAKGTLRMELRPATGITDNDGAAQFISGSRTVTFDVAAGDEVVRLRGENSIVFQAGTTAGTIVFTVEAGGFTEQASVTIAPEAVHVESATAGRNSSSFSVGITGFDNTRSVSDMSFTFYTSDGQALPGMPVTKSVGKEFGDWWTRSALGGIFKVNAAFPVTGDVSKITGVEVRMTSSQGSASSQRLTF